MSVLISRKHWDSLLLEIEDARRQRHLLTYRALIERLQLPTPAMTTLTAALEHLASLDARSGRPLRSSLVISQGAYNSEVIRAALGSIPKGQFEACRALGLNKLQTMAQVVIPQAALVAVPSLGNSFISLLKDTSLVSSITVAEILMTAKSIIAVKFQPLLLYCEAALVYLIFSTVLTQLQGMLEKKLGKHLVDTRV